MSRRLSFSEKRRRKLTVKAEVDRLETRNTITEPISVLGLASGAFRGLAQLGLIQVQGGRLAPAPLRAQAVQGMDARSAMVRGYGRPLPGDVLPFAAVPPARSDGGDRGRPPGRPGGRLRPGAVTGGRWAWSSAERTARPRGARRPPGMTG